MSEKDILWQKYSTCIGLNNFLEGCTKGCRTQWQIVKKDYDEHNIDNLLFECFLYVFCQHQFSFTFDHIVGILDKEDLKILKSKYKNHFEPFNIVANGMKHLNRMVKELMKRDLKHNAIFYNRDNTKLNFGESYAECVSEDPLKITEDLYSKAKPIILKSLEELNEKFRAI